MAEFKRFEFVCGHCGGEFWNLSDQDAVLEESVAHFGEIPVEEQVQICDDCWKMMTSEVPTPGMVAGRVLPEPEKP